MASHYDALILVNFGGLDEFSTWAGGRTAVKSIEDGLGDAAFTGPKAGDEPTMLAFRKGSRGVRLATTMVGEDGNRVVTMDQIREIASLIDSRLE